MDIDAVAGELFAECLATGQAARRIRDAADAASVRAALRGLARVQGVRIRTARLEDTVVVAQTAAALWNDDAATMRVKLTPR